MMWKPTKPGYYRFGNDCRDVWVDRAVMMTREAIHGDSMPVAEGPWSLMGPDWQPGAPTVAQLMQWPWWAIWGGSGQMMVAGMVAELRLDYVLRSAPIQPDLTNGPMWVPLEVVK